MINHEDLTELQSLLNSRQRVSILVGTNPDLDSLGSSLALYLALSRLGKAVNIACPDLPTVALSRLVGIDKVQSELGGQNLVISFPYIEGAIEKVSYNIEGDRFNLVIQPRPGSQPLSPTAVKFFQGGADAELIFILGACDLIDLGHFYEKEKELYEKIPLVVIDSHPENRHFGKINFVSSTASSLSEIVGVVLARLGINLDPDMAQNLLTGIDFATQNFSSPKTTAEAFEVMAQCLKSGARRQSVSPGVLEERASVKPQAKPLKTPAQDNKEPNQAEAPSDWLTPKIFRGSNLP